MTSSRLVRAAAFLVAGIGLALSIGACTGADRSPVPDWTGIWQAKDPKNLFVPDDAPYKPDWQAKSDAIRKKVLAGMQVNDPTAQCQPPGFPRFWMMVYPFEILMTRGQVTLLAEYFGETRRIFTDGRKHPDDWEPSYYGHSIGHWDGTTLVVDTVGLRGDTLIERVHLPHSSQLHVIERLREIEPGELELEMTLDDPVAFTRPWVVRKYFVRAPKDEYIREYNCFENNVPDSYVPETSDADGKK